ncbi:hypothetical protein ACQR1H_11025 [Bradyrhizobium sp. HKCCYLRH2015]|uniref:hypothetical protein n=1 Tax=Bradyrhizobium sp. HKCCYLRH2015 TaxID=3420742 RepID=UPI003EC02FD9
MKMKTRETRVDVDEIGHDVVNIDRRCALTIAAKARIANRAATYIAAFNPSVVKL